MPNLANIGGEARNNPENQTLFDEDGLSVDHQFLLRGAATVKATEIIGVQTMTYRTDGHVAPVLWIFCFIFFVLWLPGPGQNAFMLVFIIGFAAMALLKHQHPKPLRYKVLIRASGSLNSTVLDTTDGEQAERLRLAIENVMV